MTNDEFTFKQDKILTLTGRELAKLLGVNPSSITLWRTTRPVPEYIANLLNHHVADKIGHLAFPLTLTELLALSRLAESRGTTIENLLLNLIRAAINPPDPGKIVGSVLIWVGRNVPRLSKGLFVLR